MSSPFESNEFDLPHYFRLGPVPLLNMIRYVLDSSDESSSIWFNFVSH